MAKLITGGTGLIGSEFTHGIKISSKDYNLVNDEEIKKMFREIKPRHLIHTAAKVGGLGANINYPYDFFYQNIKMNTELINQAFLNGVERMISLSSTCVFPDEVKYPLKEDYLHDGWPHLSNFSYAFAKRMIDIQNRAIFEQHKVCYTSVLLTNVYGPNDNYNLTDSHVIPALIHKTYLSIKHNTNLEIWGTGTSLREFIFAKDVANICDILLEKYENPEPIIISNSEEISISELVTLICDIMQFKNKIIYNTSKPDGQLRKPTDTTRLKSLIGNYQFTPLKVGLEKTIDFFINNYDNVRK